MSCDKKLKKPFGIIQSVTAIENVKQKKKIFRINVYGFQKIIISVMKSVKYFLVGLTPVNLSILLIGAKCV